MGRAVYKAIKSMVKLIIQDEVNIKFEGLSVDVRRKLANKLKYLLPYARHMPQYKLGRWDGTVGFFGLGGNGYLNHLDVLLPILEEERIEIDEIEDLRHPVDLKFKPILEDYWGDTVWPKGHRFEGQPIRLRDDQVEVINRFLENPQSLQEVSTGAGKCQPLNSNILTPTGWKTFRDIKINDLVLTPSGKAVKVLDVFFPGKKDVYEITFGDGRTARACKDHIWRIYNIGWKNTKTGVWRNITTEKLISLIKNTRRSVGVQLPTMQEDNLDKEYLIDPWLMGFLLGDGSFRNNHLGFSTADDELLEKVKSKLHPDYKVKHISRYDYTIQFKDKETSRQFHSENMKNKERNSLGHIIKKDTIDNTNMYIKELTRLGLNNKLSYEKFIPEIYMNGSKDQRIALIQGLVDSDGTIDKSSVKFTSTSKQLALNFQNLIRSIGGIAKIFVRLDGHYLYKGIKTPCKDSYTISTKYPTPWDLTSLTRKKNKTNFKYQYGKTLKLNVEKIELISHEEVKCIMIDDPDHLYITDDYIVTHNTITTATLSKLCEPYGRSIIIVPNKSLVEQTEEDYVNCSLDVGVYFGDRKDFNKTHTICTWQSLNILEKRFKEGESTFGLAEFFEGVNTVIVDEVHQAKADVLKTILTQHLNHCPIRWGLTGTIPKEDHEFQSILASLGPVTGSVTAKELQDKGILAQCQVDVLQLIDTVEFKDYQAELKYLTTNEARLTHIAEKINEIRQTGNTLILVNRISSGKELERLIEGATFVSGAVKSKDRKAEYKDINEGHGKVLIATYGVAAVGINIPRIFNLVLLEPGKSFVRVIQSIGRGIRKANDKDYVQIWDITSTCKFAKRHLRERKKFYDQAQYPYVVKKIDWN